MASNQVSKKALENPYIYPGPIKDPHHFFGRERETHEILRFTADGQSVSIVGPRRVGKTSLLLHLCRPAPAIEAGTETRHLFVFLDCQRKPKASQIDIYRWMWNETLKEAEQEELQGLPAASASADEFEEAVGKLVAAGFKLTLLLDEFELMANNPQLDKGFFSHLRSLTSEEHPVSYVTSSQKPLLHLGYSDHSVLSSPFFNIFHQQPLGFLTEEEARELIFKPVQNVEGFPAYTEEEITFLFDVAHYHPLFLQIACYYLFEHKVTGGHIDRSEESEKGPLHRFLAALRRRITKRTPERSSIVVPPSKEVRQKYRDEALDHFHYAWEQLDESEQEAMRLICNNQPNKVSGELWDSLKRQCLVYEGLVYEGLVYERKPFSSVFKDFVLQEGTPEQPPERSVIWSKVRTYLLSLDLFIGVLIFITLVFLLFSVLFMTPTLLHISASSLIIAVILSLVRSYVK